MSLNGKTINSLEDFQKLFELNSNHCQGLSVDFNKELITFRIKGDDLKTDKTRAFADLAVLINKSAKTLNRTSPNASQTNNPKYALRTWLLRLGMIGEPFKETRKALLADLEGNAAFRNYNYPGIKNV